MLKRQSRLEGRKLSPQYISYIQICFVLFLSSTFITDALKNNFFFAMNVVEQTFWNTLIRHVTSLHNQNIAVEVRLFKSNMFSLASA